MINRENERYEATKIILYKGNQGGYIKLPLWLEGKMIKYELENGLETVYRKTPKNSVLTFPKMLIGQRLVISYNHNLSNASD